VVTLARAVITGYTAGGVLPVIKHIPGHGRATADSHLHLPVVTATRETLQATDFVPFQQLNTAPAAMTAHVVFGAYDPVEPASTSAIVHREVIRGHIGYDGLLMSDDLSMKALAGTSMRARAEAVLAAGTDIALHCNGELEEMEQVAAGVGKLSGRAEARYAAAIAVTRQPQSFDRLAAEACLAEVLRTTA
jgi:beta-N-acetylhexosaminidase